jgi:hypothetical protein
LQKVGEQRAAVHRELSGAEIGRPEVLQDRTELRRPVLEHESIQNGSQLQFAVRRLTPGNGRAVGQRREAHAGWLHVAVVAPVGDEITAGAAVEPRARCIQQVGARVGQTTDQTVPGRCPGADPVRVARLRVGLDLRPEAAKRLERVAELFEQARHFLGKDRGISRRLVVPDQRDRLFRRQLRDQLRMLARDVTPEQRLNPVGVQGLDDPSQVLQEHAAGTARLHLTLAAPAAELEGLVAADVDATAGVTREELLTQLHDEARVVLSRRERRGLEMHARARAPAIGRLGSPPVRVVGQPARHVAEAVLVRHQLDPTSATQAVEPAHVIGRDWRGLAPHETVVAVGKGVLGVELQLIDTQQRQ